MQQKKLRILAVDDERFNLVVLQNLLASEKYDIECCTDAGSAIDKFKKQPFDVVLLDVVMPEIDGFELRALIRSINPETPVIFLTAMVEDANGSLLKQISEDAHTFYICKSLDRNALETRIAQAVEPQTVASEQKELVERLETDLELAGEVQNVLLPPWCILDGSLQMTSLYAPQHKVSGDAFDTFQIGPGRFLFFIGDIAGHGIQAALYMSAVQSILKLIAAEWLPDDLQPHKILNRLNRFFSKELGSGNYMTCLVAIVDFQNNRICAQSAGHPPLVRCRPAANEIDFCGKDRGDIPVGWKKSQKYMAEQNVECTFDDGDVFWACTDGLYEICNPSGATLDEERILPLLQSISAEPVFPLLPYRLFSFLNRIGYADCKDDLTLIAFRKTPREHADTFHEMLLSPDSALNRRAAETFAALVGQKTGNSDLAINVELLLHEFLTNVIIHGIGDRKRSSSRIYICMNIRKNDIAIEVLDRGCEWDSGKLQKKPEVLLARLNGDLATSGRGLAIIRTIAKRITHSRYGELNTTSFLIERGEKQPCHRKN